MVSMKQYKFMLTTVKKSIILHIKVTCDPSEHSHLHRLFFVLKIIQHTDYFILLSINDMNMRIHIIFKSVLHAFYSNFVFTF